MKFECFFFLLFFLGHFRGCIIGVRFRLLVGSGIHIPSVFYCIFYHSDWVSLGMLLFVWFYYIFYLPLSLYTNNCSSYDSRTFFSFFFSSCLLIGIRLKFV